MKIRVLAALCLLLWLALAVMVAAQAQIGDLSGASVTAANSSTARSMALRAADAINIKDFGAVCDGTTDDLAHIGAALAQAAAGNVKAVYVPASATACMLSSTITLGTGVTLFAYPGTATLKPTPGNVSNPVLVYMGTNTLVYGLIIDGGGSTFGTQNNVVTAFSVSNAVLDHVTVQNTRGVGYLLSTSIVNSGVRDSVFNNIGNYWSTLSLPTLVTNNSTSAGSPTLFFASTTGVSVGHTAVGTNIPAYTTVLSIVPNTSVTLSANVSTGGVANGASIVFAVNSNLAAQAVAFCCGTTSANTDNFVRNSYFTNIGLDSVSFGNNTRPHIIGNVFPLALTGWHPSVNFGANGNGAVYVTASVDPLISLNDASGATGNGFDLRLNTGTLVLTDNRSSGNGGGGVTVSGQTACVISNNLIRDNNQYGLTVYGSSFNSGLVLGGSVSNCSITGNSLVDDQATPTQVNGIQAALLTPQGVNIDGSNTFSGNTGGAFSAGIGFNTATKENRVINPCITIDSPNEGAAYAAGGGNRTLMEGWVSGQSQSVGTWARSASTAFPGCGSSSILLTITGTRSPAAGDIVNMGQNFEGSDFQDLGFGTTSAQSLVLDFCARTSAAGTYAATFRNGSPARSYVIPYTIAANTTTCYSFSIPGDTGGAIASGSGYQMALDFDFGSGTTYQTSTPLAWTAGTFFNTSTTTVFSAQANASTFNIGSVRLFRGAADTAWAPRAQAEELILTQRRFRKTFPAGTALAQGAGVLGAVCTKNPIAAGEPSAIWAWGEPMRASPFITTFNPTSANANWRDVTAAADVTVSVDPAAALSASATGVLMTASATVATLGDVLCIQASADAR